MLHMQKKKVHPNLGGGVGGGSSNIIRREAYPGDSTNPNISISDWIKTDIGNCLSAWQTRNFKKNQKQINPIQSFHTMHMAMWPGCEAAHFLTSCLWTGMALTQHRLTGHKALNYLPTHTQVASSSKPMPSLCDTFTLFQDQNGTMLTWSFFSCSKNLRLSAFTSKGVMGVWEVRGRNGGGGGGGRRAVTDFQKSLPVTVTDKNVS